MNILSKYKYILLVANIINGKKLPDVIYMHKSAFEAESIRLKDFISSGISSMGLESHPWNILKLFKKEFKAFLLHYLNFFSSSYPALQISIILNFIDRTYKKQKYEFSDNPSILHRKETFLLPDHPIATFFQELTIEEEDAGLYRNSKFIGCKKNGMKLLERWFKLNGFGPFKEESAMLLQDNKFYRQLVV